MDQGILRKLNDRELSKIDAAIGMLVDDKKRRKEDEAQQIKRLEQRLAERSEQYNNYQTEAAEFDELLKTSEEFMENLNSTLMLALEEKERLLVTTRERQQQHDALVNEIEKLQEKLCTLERFHRHIFGVQVRFVDDDLKSDNIEVHVNSSGMYAHESFVINCRKDNSRRGYNLAIEGIDPSDSEVAGHEKRYQQGRIQLWQLVCMLRLGGSFPTK